MEEEAMPILYHLNKVVKMLTDIEGIVQGPWPTYAVRSFTYSLGPIGNKFICELLNLSTIEVDDNDVISFFTADQHLNSVFGRDVNRLNMENLIEVYGRLKFCTSATKLKKQFPEICLQKLKKLAKQNREAINNCCIACEEYLSAIVRAEQVSTELDFRSFKSSFCNILLQMADVAMDTEYFQYVLRAFRKEVCV